MSSLAQYCPARHCHMSYLLRLKKKKSPKNKQNFWLCSHPFSKLTVNHHLLPLPSTADIASLGVPHIQGKHDLNILPFRASLMQARIPHYTTGKKANLEGKNK